jgi:transposase
MFGLGPATKVYVATGAVDMRKSFDGLHGLVRDVLGREPLSGHIFLFANKPRTRLKILFWDGSGLWICAKRLEKGRFHWPEAAAGQASVTMRQEELAMLVAGVDLSHAKPRRGWLRIDKAS